MQAQSTSWCLSVSAADLPVWWANAISAVIFVGIALLVFRVPKQKVLEGAPDQKPWRDFRWWAVALVAVQLVIYYVFS